MDHRQLRTKRARDLRQSQTFAENKLWQALRGGRLDGHKFRRQFAIGRYFADFACEKLKLVIELDGGVHDDEVRDLRDQIRQQEIEALGWSVMRFRNERVTANVGAVVAEIRAQAKRARP